MIMSVKYLVGRKQLVCFLLGGIQYIAVCWKVFTFS